MSRAEEIYEKYSSMPYTDYTDELGKISLFFFDYFDEKNEEEEKLKKEINAWNERCLFHQKFSSLITTNSSLVSSCVVSETKKINKRISEEFDILIDLIEKTKNDDREARKLFYYLSKKYDEAEKLLEEKTEIVEKASKISKLFCKTMFSDFMEMKSDEIREYLEKYEEIFKDIFIIRVKQNHDICGIFGELHNHDKIDHYCKIFKFYRNITTKNDSN